MASKEKLPDPASLGRWSAEEARALLFEQERSGMSVWAWSRLQGYPSKRLYDWRRRLERQSLEAGPGLVAPGDGGVAGDATLSFVPVGVLERSRQPETQEHGAGLVELVVAPRRCLRIPVDFDGAMLLRLLRVLDEEAVC